LPVIENGVLRNYYLDTYYGRKLGSRRPPAGTSNLDWKLGEKSRKSSSRDVGEGIFVTGFIGGNSNGLTGDFSFGVSGFRIREGKLAEPVSEMNISGNHLEFWKKLTALGNDPFPYSAQRTPTLVFDGIQVAGV
jgi:PmbA protein